MKTELLKKLRKRFVFYYDREARWQPWKLFDKKTDREIYSFETGLYYYSEMVIYNMMKLSGLEDLFESNRTRRDRRIKKRTIEQRRKHFLQRQIN